uniref:NAC domain-containing protein n=1 Tax=Leersia perrieri TaxID=77586 RepID=A0A0D9W6Y8_9ORYZ
MRRPNQNQAAPEAAAASLREEEIDDGWVFLAGRSSSRVAKPPPSPSSMARAVASSAGGQLPFDPTVEDIVTIYLPCRRALRCDALPVHVHDADLYGAHPALLASVYPAANKRFEWFFFAFRRRRCPGGRRRAGPGEYRLSQEARHRGGDAYSHSFRYYEDGKETEWRMVEYGDRRRDVGDGGGGSEGFELVVCKVYLARGGAVHEMLGADRAALASRGRGDEAAKPQVLVQLYLATLRMGNPLACRVHRATARDVLGAHPAVITAVLPAANDRCEWLFAAVRQRRRGEHGAARPRKAGPGEYVAVRECRVVDGRSRDMGYRIVFWYREDDDEARRLSPTEWWMEEYGFGPDFPYGELPAPVGWARGEDEELVVYKVYAKLVGGRR